MFRLVIGSEIANSCLVVVVVPVGVSAIYENLHGQVRVCRGPASDYDYVDTGHCQDSVGLGLQRHGVVVVVGGGAQILHSCGSDYRHSHPSRDVAWLIEHSHSHSHLTPAGLKVFYFVKRGQGLETEQPSLNFCLDALEHHPYPEEKNYFEHHSHWHGGVNEFVSQRLSSCVLSYAVSCAVSSAVNHAAKTHESLVAIESGIATALVNANWYLVGQYVHVHVHVHDARTIAASRFALCHPQMHCRCAHAENFDESSGRKMAVMMAETVPSR